MYQWIVKWIISDIPLGALCIDVYSKIIIYIDSHVTLELYNLSVVKKYVVYILTGQSNKQYILYIQGLTVSELFCIGSTQSDGSPYSFKLATDFTSKAYQLN